MANLFAQPQSNGAIQPNGGRNLLTKTPAPQPLNPQQKNQQNGTDLITNVANFLGMGSLGKFAGGKIAEALPKPKVVAPVNYQGTQQQFQSNFNQQQNQSIEKSLPSNKQVLGSALQTGADIATAGIGSGGSILAGLGIAGGAGAVSGFGSALENNKSVPDSLKQAFGTGVLSAVTYGALAGAGKLAEGALEKLPTKIYASANKLESEASNVMMNDKMIGNAGKLKGLVETETARLNKTIADKISQNNGQIDSMNFLMNTFDTIKNSFKGVDDAKIWRAIGAQDVAPFLQNENVDYMTADNIRQKLGQTISWTKDTPFLQQVRETMWKNIVNEIRPNTGTTAEYAKLAPLVNAAKKLTKVAENQDTRFGLKVGSLLSLDLLGGPTVRSAIGVGTNEAKKLIQGLPEEAFGAAGKAARTTLMNYLNKIGL